MTDLTQDLRDYRAYLEEQLAIMAKATAGEWKCFSETSGYARIYAGHVLIPLEAKLSSNDATAIAAARNGYPESLRAQLRMLAVLEAIAFHGDYQEPLAASRARETLRDIIAAWKGGRA